MAGNRCPGRGSAVEQKPKTLQDLTCIPAPCPIAGCPVKCEHVIGAGWMLHHLIHVHDLEMGKRMYQVLGGERKHFVLNPAELPANRCTCLGVLLYGGLDGKEENQPGNLPICHKNKFVVDDECKPVVSHMVVMVMVCKTSWNAIFEKPDAKDPLQNIFVFWCVGPETLQPVHCTMTLCDKDRKQSRSKIMKVRCVQDSPDPKVFVAKGVDILVVTNPEVESFTDNGQEPLRLETSVYQYKVV